MPFTTIFNLFVTSARVGKRIKLRPLQADAECRLILPGTGGPYGNFTPGDFVDFHVEQVPNGVRLAFVADNSLAPSVVYVNGQISGSSYLYVPGQTARAYYTDTNRWEVEVSSPLTYDKPIIKPAPLFTGTINDSQDIGASIFHNTHIRVDAATDCTLTVREDAFWVTESSDLIQEYWMNNFFPTSPGPMPVGGTMVIGKHGVGNVIFAPGVGVTINTPDSLSITNLHGKATLIKVGEDEWDLEGNIGT